METTKQFALWKLSLHEIIVNGGGRRIFSLEYKVRRFALSLNIKANFEAMINSAIDVET